MIDIPDHSAFHRKTNWGIALATELLAPIFRSYAVRRCGSVVLAPKQWNRVLLVGDHHIGDVLYRSSSLEALKSGLRNCDLYYLVSPGSAELLDGNPSIHEILPWALSDSPLDLKPHHVAQLLQIRFDAVLCTNPIRYWPELLLAIKLGVANRAGYAHKGFSGWVTHRIPIRYPQSYPAYFRDYVSALIGRAPDWSLRPRLYPSSGNIESATTVWDRGRLDRCRPVLACFITTRQPLGMLPMSWIGPILESIRRRSSAQLVLMGATSDAEILNETNRRFGLGAMVLAGQLGLKALSVFLGRCDAVLTTDSGPRHLANAAGVPVFFFRNLWSSCQETGCYVDSETDLCPPALQRLEEKQHREVLERIPKDEVVDRVIDGLSKRIAP